MLAIEPARWCAELESLLANSGPIEDARAQVEAGEAHVYRVCEGGATVAAFVLRVDQIAAGREGVVMAAAGARRGVDLTAEILPHIERMFGDDVVSYRIHTMRPGLARKLARDGYGFGELVMRKVRHGRQ